MQDQLFQACLQAIDENMLDAKLTICWSAEDNAIVIVVASGICGSTVNYRSQKATMTDAVTDLARWVVDRMAPAQSPSPSMKKTRLLLNASW